MNEGHGRPFWTSQSLHYKYDTISAENQANCCDPVLASHTHIRELHANNNIADRGVEWRKRQPSVDRIRAIQALDAVVARTCPDGCRELRGSCCSVPIAA